MNQEKNVNRPDQADDPEDSVTIRPIARIHSPFREKFGIPRQPGLTHIVSEIHFLPEYRSIDAVRGLEGFDYLWILWRFSANRESSFHPTVRPPRLGGNTRMGVFATRSSFRPNLLALSSVKIEKIGLSEKEAPVIYVTGADLLDQTPIYDIKPYLPYSDAHPDARGGFTESSTEHFEPLDVRIAPDACDALKGSSRNPAASGKPTDQNTSGQPPRKSQVTVERMGSYAPSLYFHFLEILPGLKEVLSQDPRPAYQKDPDRVYGMKFDEFNIRFHVEGRTALITEVTESR